MIKNTYLSIAFVLMFVAFILASYWFHLTTGYLEEGLKVPNTTFSVPLHQRGSVVYITKEQDRKLNILTGSFIISGVGGMILLVMSGVSLGRVGMDFKK